MMRRFARSSHALAVDSNQRPIQAEFEAFFARPVAFLASKTFRQFRPDVFVEHGDSLYVVDRKDLIHITPENNMKNAAEFVALSETAATNTLIYFK
jgi:hypothetical protein